MFISRILAATLALIGRKNFRLAGKGAGSTAFPDSRTAAKEPMVLRLGSGAYGGNGFRSAARLDRIDAVDRIAFGDSDQPRSASVAVDCG